MTGLESSRGRMAGKEAAVGAELEAWRLELGLHLLLGMVLGATAGLEWSVMSSGARRCPELVTWGQSCQDGNSKTFLW